MTRPQWAEARLIISGEMAPRQLPVLDRDGAPGQPEQRARVAVRGGVPVGLLGVALPPRPPAQPPGQLDQRLRVAHSGRVPVGALGVALPLRPLAQPPGQLEQRARVARRGRVPVDLLDLALPTRPLGQRSDQHDQRTRVARCDRVPVDAVPRPHVAPAAALPAATAPPPTQTRPGWPPSSTSSGCCARTARATPPPRWPSPGSARTAHPAARSPTWPGPPAGTARSSPAHRSTSPTRTALPARARRPLQAAARTRSRETTTWRCRPGSPTRAGHRCRRPDGGARPARGDADRTLRPGGEQGVDVAGGCAAPANCSTALGLISQPGLLEQDSGERPIAGALTRNNSPERSVAPPVGRSGTTGWTLRGGYAVAAAAVAGFLRLIARLIRAGEASAA